MNSYFFFLSKIIIILKENKITIGGRVEHLNKHLKIVIAVRA